MHFLINVFVYRQRPSDETTELAMNLILIHGLYLNAVTSFNRKLLNRKLRK